MKRLFSILLCILMVMGTVTVSAAGLNSFITAHELQDSTLWFYSIPMPMNGNLTVTVKDQQVPNAELTTVRNEKLPVTVYCLVDLSTGMNKQQIQQQIDALNIISSRMAEGDSMVITTVGRKVTEGSVLDTPAARKAAIDTLKHDTYNVDYFQGIIDAATSLQTKTSFNANRCLLMLSTGEKRGQNTASVQDAANALSKVSFPVYVLATTGDDTSAAAKKNAENIMKMADSAVGGMALIPAKESITAAQAADKIWENIQESAVIKLSLNDIAARDNDTAVHAIYEVDGKRYEDTITVDLVGYAAELNTTDESEEPEPDESVIPDVPDEPKHDTKSLYFWIGGGAAAALLLAGILFLALRKKPVPAPESKPAVQQVEKVVDSDVIFEDDLAGGKTTGSQNIVATGYADAKDKVEFAYPKTTAAAKQEPDVTIKLSVASHQNVTKTFTLKPHVMQVLGRDDRADIILNAEDKQLSGKHCNMEWDGNYLYVQDIGSTNGTFIDNVRLSANTWSRLNPGSVITMGSFDYMVSIQQ